MCSSGVRSPTCSLLGLDLGLTLLALHGAKLLRENISWGVYLDQPLEFSPWLYLIVPDVWLVVFATLRVYRPARSLCTVADLPTVGDAIIGASLIFTGIAYLLFRELSRFLFFYFFVVIHEVIFALPPAQHPSLRAMVMSLQTLPVNLRRVPDVFDLLFIRAFVEEFAGIPIIGLREPALEGPARLIKRLFDLAMSALLLLVFLPLMLGIALLIKLDSPGPVFFRQQRVGERGLINRHMKITSFRSGEVSSERPIRSVPYYGGHLLFCLSALVITLPDY